MVFACNAGPGMSLGFPDTCNTMVGPAPVPIPYPNMATATTAVPPSVNVFVGVLPAHTMMTMEPMTNGDQTGISGGGAIVGGGVSLPCRSVMGCVGININFLPARNSFKPTMQNNLNCPGATALTPCQPFVLFLR
ncbi:MAG: DUF4150 domain-containing protein [Sneathiellaceae bacterium]